jgi:hypothetical protein
MERLWLGLTHQSALAPNSARCIGTNAFPCSQIGRDICVNQESYHRVDNR